MADSAMPGMPSLGPLGLSFADATSIANQSGAPVTFGATGVGSGSAGGTSSTSGQTAAPKGDATAVTPVTSLPGFMSQGGGAGTDLLGQSVSALASYASLGMGLNGSQVQDPLAKIATYGQKEVPKVQAKAEETAAADKTTEAGSGMPSPIALGAMGVAALIAGYFLFVR